MAKYTIVNPDGSRSTVIKHHPFGRFLGCLLGVVLVMSALLHNHWLFIPVIIIAVLAVIGYRMKSHRDGSRDQNLLK